MEASINFTHADTSYLETPVHRIRQDGSTIVSDAVAVEVPVALVINGIAYAVMMASPIALEDFAYGFAFTEGIIDQASQIYDCESHLTEQGFTLELRIAAERVARLKERKRTLAGHTGCGLCGIESLAHAIRIPPPLPRSQSIPLEAIMAAVDAMKSQQNLLAITGASHAAAWCDSTGKIVILREDIGRHNALDKVIGALLRAAQSPQEGFITITSRASYEMVQKTAIAGVPLLAAVSGVTSLAVQIAQQSGLALLGFTRGSDVSIYSHDHRIEMDKP